MTAKRKEKDDKNAKANSPNQVQAILERSVDHILTKFDKDEREQEFERQKEQNDILLGQQRLDLQEEALKDKTRVAEERIKTQRDIAAANLARRS